MFKRIIFWLNNSRLFSVPMTIMSWLVIFVYSVLHDGNIANGTLALFGILFAHLATNLFDDYVDYINLSKNEAFKNNKSKSKCRYLLSGEATLSELLKVVIIYCLIAFIIGVYLTFKSGFGVVLLSVIGGLITLTYAKLSSNGFSEFAVGTAFGPLLFEGVYYVMCGGFSLEVLIISLAIVPFTVGLVYMNNLMDYETDIKSDKKSLCCRIGNIKLAVKGLLFIHFIGYFMCAFYAVIKHSFLFTLPLITLPLSLTVYKSVRMYYEDKTILSEVRWWYYPLDNWEKIKNTNTAGFYLRLFITRNLMIWVSLIFTVSLIIDKLY